MLRVDAIQTTNRGDGYCEVDRVVGYFQVDQNQAPYTPHQSRLTVTELLRRPQHTLAWVAHDGNGNVYGDIELVESDFQDFENYDSPDHSDSFIYV